MESWWNGMMTLCCFLKNKWQNAVCASKLTVCTNVDALVLCWCICALSEFSSFGLCHGDCAEPFTDVGMTCKRDTTCTIRIHVQESKSNFALGGRHANFQMKIVMCGKAGEGPSLHGCQKGPSRKFTVQNAATPRQSPFVGNGCSCISDDRTSSMFHGGRKRNICLFDQCGMSFMKMLQLANWLWRLGHDQNLHWNFCKTAIVD